MKHFGMCCCKPVGWYDVPECFIKENHIVPFIRLVCCEMLCKKLVPLIAYIKAVKAVIPSVAFLKTKKNATCQVTLLHFED